MRFNKQKAVKILPFAFLGYFFNNLKIKSTDTVEVYDCGTENA